MSSFQSFPRFLPAVILTLAALPAAAQSFRVQCPASTITHPSSLNDNDVEPAYTGPTPYASAPATTQDAGGYLAPTGNVNGAIKCQQISGGDGYATMGDGTQTYLFSFGPLSGIANIAQGLPGTDNPTQFNTVYSGASPLQPGDPATTGPSFTYNGAVGQEPDPESVPTPGLIDGHVDPRQIMDVGVMNGNIPAPLMAIDEDDEFFLTLTNVGMIMRPDLFEQHTVHFHGYPNASAFYDGVPDASVAINIGASFTYYYLAPDAGTYFWHCHITPPEHLQMGMVGQLYVRPRQDRVPVGSSLYAGLQTQQTDLRTACNSATDILCSNPLPVASNAVARAATGNYAYNDGDGSTYYDVEYPIQIHGFDPNFHFVGMTFNPEDFSGMKDKYFMISGRSYPDTISTDPIRTQATDGLARPSQPISSKIVLTSCTSPCAAGTTHRALLRVSDLNVTEFHTLATNGIPMRVIGWNARLLRDMEGNNLAYNTNSITMGGGESADVIIDSADVPPGTYFLYTTNLDHLSNDAENLGGMMTEIVVQ